MAKPRHSHSDLIDGIGQRVVQEQFGLSKARLYAWRTRGIPHKLRVSFSRLAGQQGRIVPDDFFEGM